MWRRLRALAGADADEAARIARAKPGQGLCDVAEASLAADWRVKGCSATRHSSSGH